VWECGRQTAASSLLGRVSCYLARVRSIPRKMPRLDFTRQFALPDDDEYLQFHCDLQFTATAELQALGSHDEWWWPDEERDLMAWARDVASRPEWALLVSRTPLTTEIYCEHT
jgi:hypothetical protein